MLMLILLEESDTFHDANVRRRFALWLMPLLLWLLMVLSTEDEEGDNEIPDDDDPDDDDDDETNVDRERIAIMLRR
jgi:hypothetical protein